MAIDPPCCLRSRSSESEVNMQNSCASLSLLGRDCTRGILLSRELSQKQTASKLLAEPGVSTHPESLHLIPTSNIYIYYILYIYMYPHSGQPTSDGLQPKSDGLQPKSNDLQPKSDGLIYL